MTLSTKILLTIFAIITAGMVITGFVYYKQSQAKLLAIETQLTAQKELSDNLIRSMAQYTTKTDLDNFAKDSNINLSEIKTDLEKLNAAVAAINVSQANSLGQSKKDIPSTNVIPGANPNPITTPDQFGYQKNQQVLTLNEQFENLLVPIGNVGFSAWQDKPWTINILPRTYNASTIIGTDENQRLYTYNKFSIDINNKEYEIKINKSDTKQIYPDDKFSWWNPRLNLTSGVSANLSEFKGSLNIGATIGVFSYGKYKTSSDISFLQVGIGYQSYAQTFTGILNPINVNVHTFLPTSLINNTYIGPSIQLDSRGNILAGVNLSVGF